MSIRLVQTCSSCGTERTIRSMDCKAQAGWKIIQQGSMEITMCDQCIHALVSHIQERVLCRNDGRNPEGMTLNFDPSLRR